ncbi:uncharacterized protein Dwil_GK15919 [Drosophila willistoni]|uniref:Uncharacterized protein n=1 Tax=Drosophila willistoni TaxID=7260 RepID=B4NQ64_DROWI|nr:uncharacterized protein Dwil_GK15919 [Drosophila willistoni]
MAGFVKTRKRSREDELPCDSTPLSKRINNLHLNYDEGNSSSSSNCSLPSLANSSMDGHNPNPDGGPGPVYSYNPELSVEQNPYYYAKNKMLYDLHVERVKRNTQ